MKLCISPGKVNRKLLPVKAHYFLFFTALGCVLPFRTIFAKQLGISATAVGAIFFAIPFFRMVSNPLFGFLLDYFKRFRLTISVMTIIMCLSHTAMIFIPPKPTVLDIFNSSDITDTHLHSKVQYSCENDMLLNVSDHNITISSDYNELNATERERSFNCVMECYNSANECKSYTSKEDTEKFKIRYAFSVDIFECNMTLHLKNGKIFNGHNFIPNSLVSNINQSSLVYSEMSGQFHHKNCSTGWPEVTALNKITEEVNAAPIPTESGGTISSAAANIAIPLNSTGSRKISTVHKYRMKSDDREWFKSCALKLDIDCNIKCHPNNTVEELDAFENFQLNTLTKEKDFLSLQFWTLFVLLTASSLSFNAIIFMMDTATYELLQDDKDKYGQQRLWGTFGWGFGCLAGGYANEIFSSNSGEINYSASFYLLSIIALIDLIPVYQLKVTDLKYSSHIWKDVCFLLSKSSILYNIVVVYFIGVLSGFIWNYQFWFMEEIGASQVLLGLSQMFECIFELPWFIVSGWVIAKIGHDNCNSLTLIFFGVRYLCFAFMYDPWMTLPVGFFHGPTFGLFYSSMTMYAKNAAPPGTEATVQSLLHLCFEGIGVATGTILGGASVDHFGTRKTFLFATGISFFLFLVNVSISLLTCRTKKKLKKERDTAKDVRVESHF